MIYSKYLTIDAYLDQKGIKYQRIGKELITHCPFNNCDHDSRGSEAHFYINTETSQYQCKKCGEEGNLVTLMKHFGDEVEKTPKTVRTIKKPSFTPELVEKCHEELPERIREYLKSERGLTDELIDTYKIGYGTFYGQPWITFPIKLRSGDYAFFKLRQDPANGTDKITYPSNPKGEEGPGAQLYDWELLAADSTGPVVVCEGELDRLLLLSKGVVAVTSTHGVSTFKKEWVADFAKRERVHICFDHDDAGRKNARKVAQMLHEGGVQQVFIVNLPDEVGDKGDITDYFTKHGGTVEDLLGKYASPYPEPFDASKFKPLNSDDLLKILGLTIKRDEQNKLAAFLCQLSAYTEDSQFNISFNAPSSTGKSFIPTEIAKLFPEEDVMEIGYCSPTAFFHEAGDYIKETNTYIVDLSHKIIIFVDMPHQELLARLRPLLSHDKKIIESKITDKNQQGGIRTKTVLIIGYPSVTFCTAGLAIDEQEATRFFLLSPEITQEKLREGIEAVIRREADGSGYKAWLEKDPERALLKERIRAIKSENISSIDIGNVDSIKKLLLGKDRKLKPRNQRDAKRLLSLVKAFAVLNVWYRERRGQTLVANEEDVAGAIALWEQISVSQELNLPPYVYNIYVDIVLEAWKDKSGGLEAEFGGRIGLTYQEVLDKHYAVHGRPLDSTKFRQLIVPMLETAGLITREKSPNDARMWLIYPVVTDSIVDAMPDEGSNNSVEDPGADSDFDPADYREYE